MNYLSNLRRILVSLSFNCTFLNALVSCSADGKSIIVEVDTTKLKGNIASNTRFSALTDTIGAISRNVNIISTTDLKANVDVLGRYYADVHIDAKSNIRVEITGASANIIGDVKILSALTMISEMLIKSAVPIIAEIESKSTIKAYAGVPEPVEIEGIAQIVFTGKSKLKLFTEFTEMIAKIESTSEIKPIVDVLDTIPIQGSFDYVIDFDGKANGRLLDTIIGKYKLSSVSELMSTLNYMVKAYVIDYYNKTIENAFYGGTLEEAWRTIV